MEKEIIVGISTSLATDVVKGAWSKVCGFFKDLSNKESIDYGNAYEKYLKNTSERYGKVKTLIYRRTPKNLYSFYECMGVNYGSTNIDTSSIKNLIDIQSKIIITGTGGIGKSTMLKHFFLNAINESKKIPILIELRSLNIIEAKDISIYNILYQYLLNNGFSLEEKYFEYSMKEGAYIILFDGYDEVNSENVQVLSKGIRDLSEKYVENKYIVSSRPLEEFIGWNDFTEMTTLPLTKEQALSLISKIEYDNGVKDKFYNELEQHLYDEYTSFASNPLLLTIMLLTFDNRATIPDKLNDFYDQAFSTLFNMHDATKDAYVREIRSKLGCEDFKLVFSYICFKSFFNNEFEFSDSMLRKYIQSAKGKFDLLSFNVEDFLYDLTQSVCMLVRDGLNFRFTHRSFQEYFSAWYTCKLTDDLQKKLINEWIKKRTFYRGDNYFTMLFSMQSEKVNRIILCPILKRFKKKYDALGYSVELLSELYSGMTFDYYDNSKEENVPRAFVCVKDNYTTFAILNTCRLNNFNSENHYDENNILLAKHLESCFQTERTITFSEALQKIDKEIILNGFRRIEDNIVFSFSILSRYDKTNKRKSKLESILDDI